MSARKLAAFGLDDDLLEGLRTVWERDGVQSSEQVRRAVRQWLEGKGVLRPSPRRTVGRVHQTLRVTPAMETGVTDHVWSVEEIVALLD